MIELYKFFSICVLVVIAIVDYGRFQNCVILIWFLVTLFVFFKAWPEVKKHLWTLENNGD